MLPCLGSDTIKYLHHTADERYQFSKDFFRKTHFPQTLNRYYQNKLIEQLTENELLSELEDSPLFGNRIFIIFGSTGSGKSELLCWMKDNWTMNQNTRPVIRISRNELNPQVLVRKCYEELGVNGNEAFIKENKWEQLLYKPITIVNQIVWNTLSELLDKDEEIVPISLLLRPVIERNISNFTKDVKAGNVLSPLEIISEEEFTSLLERTTIPIKIDFNKLRSSLLLKLDDYLFEGRNLKDIFKELSEELLQKKVRPLLLIDDLVQSLNLYSSEILDFFLNLEEGNWDVVIGLTPGVIDQKNSYEKELKKRITTLDTIDDRVKKLWLSDESGNSFYSIDKAASKDYIHNYITALKELNGFQCSSSCKYAKQCSTTFGANTEIELLPLNSSLIERLYDGIPAGKGIQRYLLINTKEVFAFLMNGSKNKKKTINKMKEYIYRDIFVDNEDKLIKLLAEMVADPNSIEVTLSKRLLGHFGYAINELTIPTRRILFSTENIIQSNVTNIQVKKLNPNMKNIREWIEGKEINNELLEPLRSGVASIINDIVKPTSFLRENTPRVLKTTSTIQRCETFKRQKLPINFDGREGIIIKRNVNLLEIADFQQLRSKDRIMAFSNIANDENIAAWIFQATQMKNKWKIEMEKLLGRDIESFAYQFKCYIEKWYKIMSSEWISHMPSPIHSEIINISEGLFQDWFSLRDNMVDYQKIESLKDDQNFESWFLNFQPPKELNKFQIASYPLQSFIMDWQEKIIGLLTEVKPLVENKKMKYRHLLHYFKDDIDFPLEIIKSIIEMENILNQKNLMVITEIETWFAIEENQKYIRVMEEQIKISNNFRLLVEGWGMKEATVNHMLDSEYIEEVLSTLTSRRQVRKHLNSLIQNGYTKLPKKQWKGILKELEEQNPNIFELVRLELKMKN